MGKSVEKLHNSSHQNASKLDELYQKVLNSRKVCRSCHSYGFRFDPDGVCMGDECMILNKAYKDYKRAYEGYKEEKIHESSEEDFIEEGNDHIG